MKRVIRRGVFETNSSSMHSIVVVKDDLRKADEKYFENWIGCNGKWCLHDLGFERSPFEILSTARDKFRYAVASILGNASFNHVNENMNLEPDKYMKELIEELTQIASKIFNGCKTLEFSMSCYVTEKYGHVDHESCHLLEHFLAEEDISIEEFISNPKYIVVVDGDEYGVFNTMKKAGLINTEAIEKEFCENDYFYDYVHEEDEK